MYPHAFQQYNGSFKSKIVTFFFGLPSRAAHSCLICRFSFVSWLNGRFEEEEDEEEEEMATPF